MGEKILRFVVVLGGILFVGVIAARLFLFHPYKIPSGGMIPTFAVNAHFVANPLEKNPERGKVIVFPFPEHPDQDFVQRVVGVSGDHIRVVGGHPWINDWEVPHCDVGKYDYLDGGSLHHAEIFVEFLGSSAHLISIEASENNPTNDGTWTVKPGYAFTMGDNRMNSYDSRFWPSQLGVLIESIEAGAVVSNAPSLPTDAKALQNALDSCLSKRPTKTSP